MFYYIETFILIGDICSLNPHYCSSIGRQTLYSYLWKHPYLWKMQSSVDPCSYSRQNSKTLPYKKWIRWFIFTYRFFTWYSRPLTLGQGKPICSQVENDCEWQQGIGHFEFTGKRNCQFKESSRKRSPEHRQDWFLCVCILTEDWAMW